MSDQVAASIKNDLNAGSTDAGQAGAAMTAESGSADAAAEAHSATVNIESPKLAPEAGADAAPKIEAAKGETAAPKVEAVKPDAPRPTGKIMIMSPSRDEAFEQSWHDGAGEEAPEQDTRSSGVLGKRRISALAAVVALATVAGAVGGALATAGYQHFNAADEIKTASVSNHALEETVTRLEAELAAVRKLGAERSAKVNDRIDRVEKAQAEPAAKLARLSEAVEKLRATPPPAPAPSPVASVATPKETTGSIQPPVPTPAPKPEIARLPTVEGWVLRDVANGGALVEGRQGIFEVYAGDPLPGVGRVDAIRRQDGRWVVVTSKGLIVTR